MNFVEVELSDGTSIRWNIEDDDQADYIVDLLTLKLGESQTVKL